MTCRVLKIPTSYATENICQVQGLTQPSTTNIESQDLSQDCAILCGVRACVDPPMIVFLVYWFIGFGICGGSGFADL